MNLLVHGCYDVTTLNTLRDLGVRRFGFDLRARGQNLVPYSHLPELLDRLHKHEAILIFENDKKSTVLSFLDLLKDHPVNPVLEFRDSLSPDYYWSFQRPFYWMYQPDSSWEEILSITHLRGVLLPLKWKEHFQNAPKLWEAFEKHSLEVILHADRTDEVIENISPDISFSIDLVSEYANSVRTMDQERLRKMKLWSQLNAGPSL